ncbi:DUF3592 domain-containing protein [Natronoglomus mannanivorans]|uniref:DUF3592 domain-containing protein n=1 Tax=Natronoglomus mannanivorans TaxID=2979990 RepID=A0AAP3E3F0_9EURY|nr:DUF3592 domain-containing protein [Halobacteria archaeon AArc-xg1-1]
MNDTTKYLLAVVAGLALLWFGYSDYQTQEERLENAVEIDATVLETDIDRRSSSGSGSSYYPVVEFEYTYEGETYTSSNIDAADSRTSESSRSSAQSVVNEYPEGEAVTAYLDPAEPDEAFLETDRSWGPYLFALIGAGLTLAGFVSLTRALIADRQREGV